jgi:hypothetical protein
MSGSIGGATVTLAAWMSHKHCNDQYFFVSFRNCIVALFFIYYTVDHEVNTWPFRIKKATISGVQDYLATRNMVCFRRRARDAGVACARYGGDGDMDRPQRRRLDERRELAGRHRNRRRAGDRRYGECEFGAVKRSACQFQRGDGRDC